MSSKNQSPKGILVYIQAEGNTIHPISLELLSLGQELSNQLGEPLYAALLGSETLARELGRYDIASIYYCSDKRLSLYTSQAYTDAMEQIVCEACVRALIIGATDRGRDLAARLAGRLKTGLTADCTSLSIDTDKAQLLQTRPAFNGNVMATIEARRTGLQMATVRLGTHPADPKESGITPPFIKIELTQTIKGVRVLQQREINEKAALVDAKIVVAGGKGVANARGVELINNLAKALGAPVGSSRAAVEDGLFEYDQQIGQTGKSIHPRLYIACGISGSSHHIAGVRAETILAINRDPNAPILRKLRTEFAVICSIFYPSLQR